MVILSMWGSNAPVSYPSGGSVNGPERSDLGGGIGTIGGVPTLAAVLHACKNELPAAAIPKNRPVFKNVRFSMI